MNYHDFQLLGLPKLGVLTGVLTGVNKSLQSLNPL